MTRHAYLMTLERKRLLTNERRAAARAEAKAVTEAVAETVTLGEARGSEYLQPIARRGEREKPKRRLTGLEWLHGKKRITDEQFKTGEQYGNAYRRAMTIGAIPSILNDAPKGSDGVPLARILAHAEGTAHAAARLAMFRRRLKQQPNLTGACDLICGEELTPREATQNGADAARLEGILVVALDLLSDTTA